MFGQRVTSSRIMACTLGCAALFGSAASARADIYGFEGLTNNSSHNTSIAEAQLFVEVTSVGAHQVKFRFFNTGPRSSSITDIYFDDGTLLGIAYLIDADENGGMAGVDFSQGAWPGNLPGANLANPDFQVTAGFLADSDPPVRPNGVGPGQELGIVFNLQSGGTLADVIRELATGELRIGIHVQGFYKHGSESLINAQPIPAPGALALASMGMGMLGLWKRRKK